MKSFLFKKSSIKKIGTELSESQAEKISGAAIGDPPSEFDTFATHETSNGDGTSTLDVRKVD